MRSAKISMLLAGLGLTLIVATPARAQVCAPRKITATGATASFAFLARYHARTAWTSKVASESRLGPDYSQWLRSKERRTACRRVERRHVCLAIALPCQSRSVFAQPAKSIPANAKQRPL